MSTVSKVIITTIIVVVLALGRAARAWALVPAGGRTGAGKSRVSFRSLVFLHPGALRPLPAAARRLGRSR